MAVEKFGPLDDFERDEYHRIFRKRLEEMGRLTPRIEDQEPINVKLTAQVKPVPSERSLVLPPEVQEFDGRVLVRFGREYRMSIAYNTRNPLSAEVAGDEPAEVISAAKSLFYSAVALANPAMSEEARSNIRRTRLDTTMKLADLGRADIIGASRGFGDLPGVGQRPIQ